MTVALQLSDGTTTYDFDNSTVVNFTGYRLRTYTPGIPADGQILDTIVVDIHGTSVDNALERLRNLKAMVLAAGEFFNARNFRGAVNLQFRPLGSTNWNYSVVVGGVVSEGGFDYLTTKAVIPDVVITLRREAYWRKYPLLVPNVLAPYQSMELLSVAWDTPTTPPPWNRGVITVGGNLPALVSINTVESDAVPRRFVIGYRSQRMNPTDYQSGLVEEAESWSVNADTSTVADATASGGNMRRCTFATIPTNAYPISSGTTRAGVYRAFARLKVSAGTTANVNIAVRQKHYDYNGPTIVVINTAWQMIDLGPVEFRRDYPTPGAYQASARAIALRASRTGGAGNLDIDGIWFIPVDEGYLQFELPTLKNNTFAYTLYYDTTRLRTRFGTTNAVSGLVRDDEFVNGIGQMAFQPGAGTLYILHGDLSWQNSVSTGYLIYPHAVPLYSAPRGAA